MKDCQVYIVKQSVENTEQILIECKKKEVSEVSTFARKKSFSVDLQESPTGVWNTFRNKAEQFFGLNDSHRGSNDDTSSDVWEDAIDDDLNNISMFVHQVLEPPPQDCYCVAVYM